MKRLRNVVVALLMVIAAQAKDDPKYPVSQIPEELKTGMYAVIREEQLDIDITSISGSTTYHHLVITILSSKARDYASTVVGYDKLRLIKSFKGTVYDADGNVIKKLKQNEIYDQSAYDGFSLYSDARLKQADLSQAVYPYTVEFEYTIEKKMLYELEDFYLYKDDEVSTQKSTYSIRYPASLKPRYKLFKVSEPKVSEADGKQQMQWTFENVKPQKFEKLSPDISKVVPNITVAPNEFEYEGYAGNMKSWAEYGAWQNELNKGRDVLPEATKQKVRQLTKDVTVPEQKVKILYEYLQSKTRYVSIQLGIGGFQPFPASVVDETGYGDCKALSNYMVAMLKEVGIKGYYTTVEAGEGDTYVDASFPSDQSNHVIVAVPNGADTLWLECTSQTAPFNYQGTFTGDRKALMVTEDGGHLVNTHRYSAQDNLQSRTADVFVEASGNARAKVKTTYKALQYENDNLNFILNNQFDAQKKWVQRNTQIPAFDIMSFKMTEHKAKMPSAVVDLELALPRFASVSGKRLFLTPNLMNRSTMMPEKTDARKYDVVMDNAFMDLDTIHYHLPDGIYPETLPQPVTIKSRFGEYENSMKLDQNGVIYTRKLKMIKGEFPAASYQELIDFYRAVNKADNSKIVFLSKT